MKVYKETNFVDWAEKYISGKNINASYAAAAAAAAAYAAANANAAAAYAAAANAAYAAKINFIEIIKEIINERS